MTFRFYKLTILLIYIDEQIIIYVLSLSSKSVIQYDRMRRFIAGPLLVSPRVLKLEKKTLIPHSYQTHPCYFFLINHYYNEYAK